MRAQVTIAASYKTNDGEPIALHLDALALRWAERLGRPVARQEVVKALLEAGLKEHPVSDDEVQRAKARGSIGGRPSERPSRPKLALATIDGRRLLVEEKGRGDAGRVGTKKGTHRKAA